MGGPGDSRLAYDGACPPASGGSHEMRAASLDGGNSPGGSGSSDDISDESGYEYGAELSTLIIKQARPGVKYTRTIPTHLHQYNAQRYSEDHKLEKYWAQRYRLWSRFDEGICMDDESWYSVTPELVAIGMAERLKGVKHDVLVDAFSGAGGNTIQFALIPTVKTVIAIDIDPVKLAIAKHNASVYGVASKIEYILGDFTQLLPHIEADCVFLSPPWGGPGYNTAPYFDLHDMQLGSGNTFVDGVSLFHETRKYVTSNIMYYLPKNVLAQQLTDLAESGETVEVESNILTQKVRAVTAYYGDFVAASQNKKRKLPNLQDVPDSLLNNAKKRVRQDDGSSRNKKR